ncbi:hypothetical protein D9M69_339350 [compost metagenome]
MPDRNGFTSCVDQLPSATTTRSATIGSPLTTAPVTASPCVIRLSIERLYRNLTPSVSASCESRVVNNWQSPVSSLGRRRPPLSLWLTAASAGSLAASSSRESNW